MAPGPGQIAQEGAVTETPLRWWPTAVGGSDMGVVLSARGGTSVLAVAGAVMTGSLASAGPAFAAAKTVTCTSLTGNLSGPTIILHPGRLHG